MLHCFIGYFTCDLYLYGVQKIMACGHQLLSLKLQSTHVYEPELLGYLDISTCVL